MVTTVWEEPQCNSDQQHHLDFLPHRHSSAATTPETSNGQMEEWHSHLWSIQSLTHQPI